VPFSEEQIAFLQEACRKYEACKGLMPSKNMYGEGGGGRRKKEGEGGGRRREEEEGSGREFSEEQIAFLQEWEGWRW
jgi:hypothetical protein